MSERESLPKIDLTTFFLSISSSALLGLGILPPGMDESHAKDLKKDLNLARHNIDLLELMQEKTQGNRTPEEDRLLEQLLFETRMRFLEVEKGLSSNDKST